MKLSTLATQLYKRSGIAFCSVCLKNPGVCKAGGEMPKILKTAIQRYVKVDRDGIEIDTPEINACGEEAIYFPTNQAVQECAGRI